MNPLAAGTGAVLIVSFFVFTGLSVASVAAEERPAQKPLSVAELGKVVGDRTKPDRARLEAAKTLAESPDPEALLPLFEVIRDAHEKGLLRVALVRTLNYTSHKKTVIPFLEERLANKEDSREVRAAAASTLGALGEPSSKQALLRASSDPTPEVRQAARSSLLNFGGEGVDRIRILIETLQDQDQPAIVRAPAATRLGEAKDPRALPPLFEALREKSMEPLPPKNFDEFLASRAAAKRNVPASAARALGLIGDPQAISPLLSLVSSENAELRISVFEALATMKAREAVSAARKAIAEDAEYRVRRWAAVLLKEVASKEALTEIRRALRDSDPGVRVQAAQAIEKIKDEEARKNLEEALSKETNPEVRAALTNAIRSLRETAR